MEPLSRILTRLISGTNTEPLPGTNTEPLPEPSPGLAEPALNPPRLSHPAIPRHPHSPSGFASGMPGGQWKK